MAPPEHRGLRGQGVAQGWSWSACQGEARGLWLVAGTAHGTVLQAASTRLWGRVALTEASVLPGGGPPHPQARCPPSPAVVRTVRSVCLGSALTASRRTRGMSRTVRTPSSTGRAEGASLPRCLCPCDLLHRGCYLRSSGACARLPALSSCASTPAAAGREAAGAQSRAPAASSVVTTASPSWKEARTGGARMLCG